MIGGREQAGDEPIRIVRVIARLNIGGPSIQAITLSRRMEEHGYRTTLVRGVEEPDEGNMDHLAAALGVTPVAVRWMRRNPGWRDLPALIAIVRILRRERPRIVHTHAAKGGTLGRLATVIAFPRRRSRPVLIHTYHGHSLTGYFSPRLAATYRLIEHFLARFSDRLVAVSDEVRDELISLGVAPASKFEVVRLGFDLSPFTINGRARERARSSLRAELGISGEERVVTLVARLVPIKRVDRFLEVAQALRDIPGVRFVVVGDGALRDSLRASPVALDLEDRLIWAGFRRDMPAVYFASDAVVQTSDNEGTPVSLIEAQAAGIPVVSTDVGGARSVVDHGLTGFIAPCDDPESVTGFVRSLLADPGLSGAMGARAREHVPAAYSLERLGSDLDALYRRELAKFR